MPRKQSTSSTTKQALPDRARSIKQFLLTAAITIVLTTFIFYAIATFYPEPQWDTYCGARERSVPKFPEPYNNITKESCEAVNGTYYPEGKWCDYYTQCNTAYNDHNNIYQRNAFIIALITSIIIIGLGVLLALPAVSVGIMSGGVLTLIIAVLKYWNNLGNYLRLLILALALALLIWLGYKKFSQ